ncbi:cellulose-binding protein, partial [Limosilactobacillus reuteri]
MPTEVSVSAKDTTAEITLPATQGATSYVVYRDGIQIGPPVGTSYSDSALTPEKPYTYVVVAVTNNGNSPKSAEVVITTSARGTETAGESVKATYQAIQTSPEDDTVISANCMNL